MMAGFKEAYRILKPNGKAIYNMSLVDDLESNNTKKWIDLYLSLPKSYHNTREYMKDSSQWIADCEKVGFSNNNSIKVYGRNART
jgi:ubiquinone/menaquinone biosynthesis C-methylase UbiE